MEMTIERALQQGVAAHKEDKLQEAERFYRAILQSQPLHPDANHNLGVIAVSVNQAKAALPLFKTAVEADPKIEQFWLSYIDALIKEKQRDTAEQVIEKAHKQGVDGNKLKPFKSQLRSITKTGNISNQGPSQKQVSTLLDHYQNGHYSHAEKLAILFTQEFPEHPFGWKVLGAVLGQTDRNTEALYANQKAIAISPQDAEAHGHLGVTLKELGKLDEAEASFRHALKLKPDYAEIHINLGATLKDMGRLEEAEASLRHAIKLKCDYAEVHSNLGATLKDMGRMEEAEQSFRQAIKMKPDYAKAHNNLGITLQQLGRLKDAEASFRQALAFKPDYASAKHMLAALTGITTATAPRDYVEGLFDDYAANFESSLVENLEYNMPSVISKMIIKDSDLDLLGSILDLGCGTGLLGSEIKQFCTRLEGIDLSGKMLDIAEKKNIYNKLTKQDILVFLSNARLNFDYFTATDVFIYIGDLTDVFRLIKSRNEKGGKLAFSTEDYDGDGFFLEKSGRYSHSKNYIKSLCETFNYRLRYFDTHTLRKESAGYINGGVYLLDF